MKVETQTSAPGTYRVILAQEDLTTLTDFRELPRELLRGYCQYLADMIGLQYVNHTIYDYALLIERDQPITGGSSVWHNDSVNNDIDCILMIYNVTPELNSQTGMRIGYRDHSHTVFLDLRNGDAFLHRQDKDYYQHKVEDKKGPIIDRACLSINLKGFSDLAQRSGLSL